MRIRWLGWAGVEIEAQDERVLVDPLQDAAAVFGWLGERGRAIPLPEVVAAAQGRLPGSSPTFTAITPTPARCAPLCASTRRSMSPSTTAARAASGSQSPRPTRS